jgi:AcrR family transcriptional regulator
MMTAPKNSHPPTKSARVSRRTPRQERSRDTVDCILEAAAQVFGRLGYAGTTTNKIARRAGVSIGSLYQYFSSKEDILRVLLENHRREAREVIEAARRRLSDPDVPLEQGLRSLLSGLHALHSADPGLSRVLAHGIYESGGRKPRDDAEEERYVAVVRDILVARPDVAVEDPEMAARVVVRTVEQVIRWLGHESDPTLDAEGFLDELLAMLVSYLTSE